MPEPRRAPSGAPLSLPPLPSDLRQAIEAVLGSDALSREASAGLVWGRYARAWSGDAPAESKQRTGFLARFAAGFQGQRHREPELRAHQERLDGIAEHRRDFVTVGRFVTGLGAEHPVENGFTFDPLLGVPMLPGSSVKGLCRAAAKLVRADPKEVEHLLGSDVPQRGREDELHPGEAVFLGAWPLRWPELDVDVLNPHHPDYYQDQGFRPEKRKRLARQTEEPKPVCFLTVASGTRFRFWIRGRAGRSIEPQDAETVWGWLETGLEALGAGGKTAAGYGHMARG